MSGGMSPENFRDVGFALTLWLEPPPLPLKRLFRGGKLDALTAAEDIGNPRTVLNLRRGPDPKHWPDVHWAHLAAANDLENYDTTQKAVRIWLASVLSTLSDPSTAWPVYVHCTSGRDRTGIVVAAALLCLGVSREVIVGEYMLSDGAVQANIETALDGLSTGFANLGVDAARLRRALLGREDHTPGRLR